MKKGFLVICSILLVLVVSLAGLIPGCAGPAKYSLTMAVNPAGAGTTTPSGTTSHAANDVVNIQATPLGSYQFVKWTAPAGTFANANAAATTFTMPAQNVTVTANFVGPLDHFKCYNVVDVPSIDKIARLEDQFVNIQATVKQAIFFANPAEKTYEQTVSEISNPDHHLTFYNIQYDGAPGEWLVQVENQFGNYTLTVHGPIALAVPTQKVEPRAHKEPLSLDHFLVYAVINGPWADVSVGLEDEFGNDTSVMVGQTFLFLNPVKKTIDTTVTEIAHPDDHLVFYIIYNTKVDGPQVTAVNQLSKDEQTLNLGEPATLLGVPSQKKAWEEQIDHFTCYPLLENLALNKTIRVKDQFVDIAATVGPAYWFCNPAQKFYEVSGLPILNPDHHFTIYGLTGVEPRTWLVDVTNQFGSQYLTVFGPVMLAVPTQKLLPGEHEAPVGLDHYLLYAVMFAEPLQIPIGLADQFGTDPGGVTVWEPYLFANPVEKTVGQEVTEIENELAHLVFYTISDSEVFISQVLVDNQFVEPTYYDLAGPSAMLAVPSVKLRFGETQ